MRPNRSTRSSTAGPKTSPAHARPRTSRRPRARISSASPSSSTFRSASSASVPDASRACRCPHDPLRVLVVGGGGREHALSWRLARSPSVADLLAAPGNPGIAHEVAECVPVEATDIDGIVELVERRDVDLTVVGPEMPLVAGVADALRERGRRVFGPGAEGARLEGSKAWAKALCERHGIPTGRSVAVTSFEEGVAALA